MRGRERRGGNGTSYAGKPTRFRLALSGNLPDGVGLRLESAISRPTALNLRRLDRPETGRVTGDARRVYLPSLLDF